MRIRNLCADEDTTYTYNTNAKLSMLLMKTTNGVTTKYVYGRGLIGEEVNNTFKTYHFDCRGSTIAITDASGTITDTFAYDTYGKLLTRTGTNKVIFGYNGRDGVATDDNGLIYMRARYYSPEMKRFINADVIAGAISNAITLNRFAYANGNPVSFVDPFGLTAERGNWAEAVDRDNNGTIDYYIYEYTYKSGMLWWKEQKIGKVYIFVNVDAKFFENEENRPEDFNSKTDIMIGDFTDAMNPNMYAYQAHKISKKHREKIIKIMLQYDQDFDTPWNRTEDSLLLEWEEHHKYRISESAKNIDFDNNEENFTRWDFFKKAWNRFWGK